MGTLSPCFVKGLHNELPEGGKIILLFGSNYTEGRGGGCPGDYQIWSQFTTFQIQESESDANRGENRLTLWSYTTQQPTKSKPLVFQNKQRQKMINERGSLVNFDTFLHNYSTVQLPPL